MGTNYYAITKNKEVAEKYFPYDYSLTDVPYFGYEIHIGKRSAGWKPLFQEHPNAYKSVAKMLEFFKGHEDFFQFYDEYLKEMTLADIKDELIDWGEYQAKNDKQCRYRFDFDKTAHPYSDMVPVEDGEPYDVEIPFDHITYDRAYVDARHKNGFDGWRGYYENYFRDPEGYDFTTGDFS